MCDNINKVFLKENYENLDKKDNEFIYLRLKRELKPNKYQIKKLNMCLGYRTYLFNKIRYFHKNILKDNYGKYFRDIEGKFVNYNDIRDMIYKTREYWEYYDDDGNESIYSPSLIDTTLNDYKTAYRFSIERNSKAPGFIGKEKSKSSFRFDNKSFSDPLVTRHTFAVIDNKYLRMPRITDGNKYMIKMKEPLYHGKYKSFQKYKLKSVTIIREAGRYYAVFIVRIPHDDLYIDIPEKVCGIDVGCRTLAYLAYKKENSSKFKYKIYDNNRTKRIYAIYDSKIKHYHKLLNRKIHGSKNWWKIRRKLQKIWKRITNVSNDEYHRITTNIVRKYQYVCVDRVYVLPLIRKIKNKKTRKFIYTKSMYKFYKFLLYKYDIYGGELYLPENNYPSTQICSNCGKEKKNDDRLSISEKKYKCKYCGYTDNRDKNAAKNLMQHCIDIAFPKF